MNQIDPTQDRLTSWLQEEASGELPDWVLGATFERTRHEPQRTSAWARSRVRLHDMGRRPGRRSTMFLASRAVAVVALIALGTGVAFTLRPAATTGPGVIPAAESASPSAGAAALPREAVYVHGAFRVVDCCTDGVETTVDGAREDLRHETWNGTATFDDPRLSGTYSLTLAIDEYPQPATIGSTMRVEVSWGPIRIENEGGAWDGTFSGTYDSNGSPELSLVLYELTGEGAYEGLSTMLFEHGSYTTFPDRPVAGAIFPGDLPPNR